MLKKHSVKLTSIADFFKAKASYGQGAKSRALIIDRPAFWLTLDNSLGLSDFSFII